MATGALSMTDSPLGLSVLQIALPAQNKSESQSPWSLITTKGEIRILDLLPGRSDDPVNCKTRSVLLADKPHYEAISYVWGSQNTLKTINISGFEVQVTRSLFAILRQFRYPDRKRALWIDQLCINQNDMVEKTDQVALMRDIYQECAECQVWLGAIENLDFSVPDAENAFAGVREMANPNKCPEGHVPLIFTSDEGSSGARLAFRNIFTHFGNPWWTRVWTVQEVVLPSKVTMNYGDLKIDLAEVKRASTNCLDGQLPESWAWAPYRFTPEMNEYVPIVRGLICAQDGEPALYILWRWCPRQATDSRDMVYALIGIFPLNPSWTMAPDYTLSTAQVYARATIELVRQMNDLTPMIGMRGLPRLIEALPTWAQDFTVYREITPLSWSRFMILSRYRHFTASNDTAPMIEDVDGNNIRMGGFNFDTITATGRFLGEDYWNHISKEDLRKLANDWKIWLEQFYGPGCDLQMPEYADLWEAFLRTLLGNDIANEEFAIRLASADDLKELQSFLTGANASTDIIMSSLRNNLVNQALFRTSKGRIGIGPATLATGDEVWIFYGGRMPFIMRPGPTYEMIGEAYVHGIMDGQAMEMGLNEEHIIVT